jgi:hypothetical protein
VFFALGCAARSILSVFLMKAESARYAAAGASCKEANCTRFNVKFDNIQAKTAKACVAAAISSGKNAGNAGTIFLSSFSKHSVLIYSLSNAEAVRYGAGVLARSRGSLGCWAAACRQPRVVLW